MPGAYRTSAGSRCCSFWLLNRESLLCGRSFMLLKRRGAASSLWLLALRTPSIIVALLIAFSQLGVASSSAAPRHCQHVVVVFEHRRDASLWLLLFRTPSTIKALLMAFTQFWRCLQLCGDHNQSASMGSVTKKTADLLQTCCMLSTCVE